MLIEYDKILVLLVIAETPIQVRCLPYIVCNVIPDVFQYIMETPLLLRVVLIQIFHSVLELSHLVLHVNMGILQGAMGGLWRP